MKTLSDELHTSESLFQIILLSVNLLFDRPEQAFSQCIHKAIDEAHFYLR